MEKALTAPAPTLFSNLVQRKSAEPEIVASNGDYVVVS